MFALPKIGKSGPKAINFVNFLKSGKWHYTKCTQKCHLAHAISQIWEAVNTISCFAPIFRVEGSNLNKWNKVILSTFRNQFMTVVTSKIIDILVLISYFTTYIFPSIWHIHNEQLTNNSNINCVITEFGNIYPKNNSGNSCTVILLWWNEHTLFRSGFDN